MGRWTKAEVDRLRDGMAAQGFSTDEVAGEIRYRCGCSKLAAYRLAHGLSQPQVVARYEQVTGRPMSQPLLSKLEQFPDSDRAPQAGQLIGLAMVYATTPLRLLATDVLDQLDPHERSVLIRCNVAFVPPQPPCEGAMTGRPDTLERGEASRVLGAGRVRLADGKLELERQVMTAARKALRFSATVEGSNVGPETLEQLHDEVARLARAYLVQPIPTLVGDLAEVQDVAFRLLEGRQRPADTRELYLLAGVMCSLLAEASLGLGDPHTAMTQARTGYICADNAGHDGLRAWIRGFQSMTAYWAGWPHEALRYAQLGADAAARASGTAAVYLPALEARAYAVLGEAVESREAVERARIARERVVPDELDEFGGQLTFTRPRQLYYAADATVWLPGEEERAEREAAEAVDAYEHAEQAERSYVNEALARADLALARGGRGELDGARAALLPVLDLAPQQRVSPIITSTMRVYAVLHDPRYRGSSAARGMQEEIEGFCQVTAAALPH